MGRTERIGVLALLISSLVCCGMLRGAFAQTNEPNYAASAFEKLKSLAGRWEAETKIGTATATYEVVSGGNAVLEHLSVAGKHDMITVYHLDHNRVLLTHYCDSGSQPRMQASGINAKTNSIEFHFVDVTNLAAAEAMHMHDLVLKLGGPNQLTENWTMFQDGKTGPTESFEFRRVN
jgi:hypothetical protein